VNLFQLTDLCVKNAIKFYTDAVLLVAFTKSSDVKLTRDYECRLILLHDTTCFLK